MKTRLLAAFVLRDLHGRYTGSALGLFWSFINPVLTIGILTVVFSVIFQVRFADGTAGGFVPVLVVGFLPWLAIQEGSLRAGASLTANPTLVRSAKMPLSVLPTAAVVASVIHQLLATALVVAILCMLGHVPSLSGFLLFLGVLVLQIVWTTGIGLALASLAAHLRDIVHVAGALFMVWMYATPIAYPMEMVPAAWHPWFYANPLAHLVSLHRHALLGVGSLNAPGQLDPVTVSLCIVTAGATLTLGAGLWVHHRLSVDVVDTL